RWRQYFAPERRTSLLQSALQPLDPQVRCRDCPAAFFPVLWDLPLGDSHTLTVGLSFHQTFKKRQGIGKVPKMQSGVGKAKAQLDCARQAARACLGVAHGAYPT